MTPLVACTAAAVVVAVAGAIFVQLPIGQQPPPAVEPAHSPNPLLVRIRRRRLERRMSAAVPAFLEDVARSVRSGASMRTAVEDASGSAERPLAADAARLVARLDRGITLEEALARWAGERRDVRAVQLVAAALPLAASAGGSMGRVVDGVADTIRADLAVQAEVRSLAAQARTSAVLVAGLPVVFGVVAGALDPRTMTFLLQPGLGLWSLGLGLVLDGAGFWWMRRIARSVT